MFKIGDIVKHRGNHYDAETGLPSISIGFIAEEVKDDYIMVQWFDGALTTHNHYWIMKMEEEEQCSR